MTKKDSLNLYQDLQTLGNLTGVKFAYAVSKNMGILKSEIEALEKVVSFTDDYKKFDELRLELVKKFARKDDKGELIIKDNNYDVSEKQKEFDVDFEVLKGENQEVWDAREEQLKEYRDLLETDSSVELHKIAMKDIPVNISVAQMNAIFEIVVEDIPSPYTPKK